MRLDLVSSAHDGSVIARVNTTALQLPLHWSECSIMTKYGGAGRPHKKVEYIFHNMYRLHSMDSMNKCNHACESY